MNPLYINLGALQHIFVATCYYENDSLVHFRYFGLGSDI